MPGPGNAADPHILAKGGNALLMPMAPGAV